MKSGWLQHRQHCLSFSNHQDRPLHEILAPFYPQMSPFLLIIGLLVFWQGCRTFNNRYIQKLGAISFLAASFCVGYFLGGGSIIWGCVTMSIWFVLPWIEIATRVRKLRLPLTHKMIPRHAPSRQLFPHLPELTQSLNDEGFEQIDDVGWEWEGNRQFVRLFYNEGEKTQAAIHFNEQGSSDDMRYLAFIYLSVSSKTKNGNSIITWEYPFSYPMQFAPEQRVQRMDSGMPFKDMYLRHQKALAASSEQLSEQPAEELVDRLEMESKLQIDHNLAKGFICDAGEGTFRYSWRGCFFIWIQLLKDMIRV